MVVFFFQSDGENIFVLFFSLFQQKSIFFFLSMREKLLEISESEECNLIKINICFLGCWFSESPSNLPCSEAIQKHLAAVKISKMSDCEVCHSNPITFLCSSHFSPQSSRTLPCIMSKAQVPELKEGREFFYIKPLSKSTSVAMCIKRNH